MTTRLQLYNAALRLCGERRIATLSENRESRRLLDNVWDDNGVRACLEQGQWNFAMRAQRVAYSTDVTPPFGYQRAFLKPDDWVMTAGLCADPYFKSPILQYTDERGYWYADPNEIYVRYVSDDEDFGGDLSLWTESFSDYAAAHFADKIILKLTSDKDRVAIIKRALKDGRVNALNRDAMAEPTKMPAPGTWVRSRWGRGGRRNDGGSQSNLIG